MLELRPVCEHCGKALPNGSTEAMICSFECTFCLNCVEKVLRNICPNCGGGFERRPVRPVKCVTPNCLKNYPATTHKTIKKINSASLLRLQKLYRNTSPEHR
ncbi:MAG: DUF1272 domain-containing protein [Saprospiraceae bacterium]|nr:DUF1272 domain-containing protein [Saprospiraceae bacterium]